MIIHGIEITDDAIKEAKRIGTPLINEKSPHSKEWKIAFDWYNKFVNKKKYLSQYCIPCYAKVLNALLLAKKEPMQDLTKEIMFNSHR